MTQILPYGDEALLVNFEQRISLEINFKVFELVEKLRRADIKSIKYLLPAYCSLTVGFDSKKATFEELRQEIEFLLDNKIENKENKTKRKLLIPVCYDEDFGIDLQEVSAQTGLNIKKIIQLHTSREYTVFMLGFLPGFPYLGSLPDTLRVKRKGTPRLRVPALSVGLAGLQTGIYPTEAPGGWQIIGRTPEAIFSPEKEKPFRFQSGDKVQFYEISKSEFSEKKVSAWTKLT